jgi:hypothetical protein
MKLAEVCRHSWNVIRLSFAALPRLAGAICHSAVVERRPLRLAEQQLVAAPSRPDELGEQLLPQHRGDRDVAPVVGLRGDLTRPIVPAELDADEARVEVNPVRP